MQKGGGRARPAVEDEGQRPVRRGVLDDIGGVEHRGALFAGLVVERERAGGGRIGELAGRRVDRVLGRAVARQQPQDAFSGRLLGLGRAGAVGTLVLRDGGADACSENNRKHQTHNGSRCHGTPGIVCARLAPPGNDIIVDTPAWI